MDPGGHLLVRHAMSMDTREQHVHTNMQQVQSPTEEGNETVTNIHHCITLLGRPSVMTSDVLHTFKLVRSTMRTTSSDSAVSIFIGFWRRAMRLLHSSPVNTPFATKHVWLNGDGSGCSVCVVVIA